MHCTLRNMKDYAQPGLVMLDPNTGAEYSTNLGDYWDAPLDTSFLGAWGTPMVLVVKRTVWETPQLPQE